MKPLKILFICTHNRCRSILAEAVANHYGAGLIQAVSAGSAPAGHVHPATLAALERHQIGTASLHSKSWDVFGDAEVDVVITVCDQAVQEVCPLWLGNAAKVHWGLRDPSAGMNERDENNSVEFDQTIALLVARIQKIKDSLQQGLTLKDIFLLPRNLAE